jgi:hypothetical protein
MTVRTGIRGTVITCTRKSEMEITVIILIFETSGSHGGESEDDRQPCAILRRLGLVEVDRQSS